MFSGFIESKVSLIRWQMLSTSASSASVSSTGTSSAGASSAGASSAGASSVGVSSAGVSSTGGARFIFERPAAWHDLQPGHSVNVNGVCLSLEKFDAKSMQFFLSPETLRITRWQQQRPSRFNVERALKFGARLHGHLVTGHAEALARVEKVDVRQNSSTVALSYPSHLSPYIFSKCSLALNGVSMTAQEVRQNSFTVCVVPETFKGTNLGQLRVGELVVLESDHSHRYAQQYALKKGEPRDLSLHSIDELVADVRRGHMVILVDDEERENEGDIVMPADFITPEAVNFIVTHARGLMCLALSAEQVQRLQLWPMVPVEKNATRHKTAFMVSVEAAEGISTGISAADRARTVWVASRPEARPSDVISPGHVFPLQACRGGVLERAGHTEGSVELMRLAGLTPAAVICEVMKSDGTMARLPDLLDLSSRYGIKVGSIKDLRESLLRSKSLARAQSVAPHP